jgi:hypothetical protein
MEQSLIRQKFRTLADTFQHLAGAEHNNRDADQRSRTKQDEAGKLVIRAFKLGCLPQINGLSELVDQIDNPPEPPRGVMAYSDPCPRNLWLDLCGNNVIDVVKTALGCPKVVRGFHGGLLPSQYPEVLPGWPYGDRSQEWKSEHELWATVCRWLSEQIVDDPVQEWSEPMTSTDLGKKFDVGARTVLRWFKGDTPGPGIEIRKAGRMYQYRTRTP